ncbi:hypothetical protein G3I59_08905 [Amycolatopsis rubida]|uniref:DUF6545 domain-containing protein n=1 Tax=Amycolatopsis rubida TaxID=112413 RepID=A0ABX0BMI1_9PSEU|nr:MULTISPECIES: DUF6545 domain-containing protein [Amycolatopsis]MYW90726.1 hypothetical protein [Amycolatopsis rubida]NEC55709.1 hypothetical protein [Amycolatopsis rubida]OAP19963.1 hypothetical protein A4R44_09299 [Amycolatopsis sp. M39]
MLQDTARQAVIVIVLTTLAARFPYLLRNRMQRPLFLTLAVFATSSVIIQSWFAARVNQLTDVPKFSNLFQGIWGLVDITATLYFAVRITGFQPRHRYSKPAWIAWALATAAGMSISFALTPPAMRFSSSAQISPFTAYALIAAAYMVGTALTASWLLWRNLADIEGRVLRTALTMVMAGDAIMVPFMAIRTAERMTPIAPALSQAAILLSTARFVLLPLGCVVVAVEPLRKAIVCQYRRIRLYSFWRWLRSATPELTLTSTTSRWRDLFDTDRSWEVLHQRVIEVRDSIFYLYDTRAFGNLLTWADDYAKTIPRRTMHPELITTACWLVVAHRSALANNAPRTNEVLESEWLPRAAADATMRQETRYFLELYRTIRSQAVQTFADKIAPAANTCLASSAHTGSSRPQ